MPMIEKMIETRAWKKLKGLIGHSQCRSCKEQQEAAQHVLAGCQVLASSKYLTSHKRAPMVITVALAKEKNLLN